MSQRRSGLAVGLTMFAGIIMMLLGVMHILWGLSAVIKDHFFVAAPDQLIAINVTGWGWIHLILGVVVFVAGYSLFGGAVWARTVAVILASISGIGNFLSIPNYPVWAIVMLALDVFVIWALTVRGRDIARD